MPSYNYRSDGFALGCSFINIPSPDAISTTATLVASMFPALYSERIVGFWVGISAVSGSPVVRARLFAVDSVGAPSGSALETVNFSPTVGIFWVDTSSWTTVLTAGSYYTIVLDYVSGTSFSAYSIARRINGIQNPDRSYTRRKSTDTGATWATAPIYGYTQIIPKFQSGFDRTLFVCFGSNVLAGQAYGAVSTGVVIKNISTPKLICGAYLEVTAQGAPTGDTYVDVYVNSALVRSTKAFPATFGVSVYPASVYFEPFVADVGDEISILRSAPSCTTSTNCVRSYTKNVLTNIPSELLAMRDYAYGMTKNGSTWTIDTTSEYVGCVLCSYGNEFVEKINRRRFFSVR